MKILGGFYDRNAAICMLSLGLDDMAYNVLKALPENSTHRYLSAIACVRLGYEAEAVEHLRAVAFNPALRYRGRLDPEISPLLERLTELPERAGLTGLTGLSEPTGPTENLSLK
jgi:hypothetical protein